MYFLKTKDETFKKFKQFKAMMEWASIKCVVKLVTRKKWRIRHLDIKIAFLDGILKQEVNMKVPNGWKNENSKEKVC
uniref:Reverse transcriptase Ty1/copia-type domain-containing protein n=1 Tax=Physcomitrium patens TaxID=3218 RepID=A0A2K1J1S4_PHYPA|nr:hypothetical protein PHYPA_023374 [Physcomitrium patens]